MIDWRSRRVMVIGGGGFLGQAVVRRLQEAGAEQIFVPRSVEYDLRTLGGVHEALKRGRPDLIFHLAAVVGGIGANLENPSRLFYENAIMGIQLIEEARVAGVAKFVTIGTVDWNVSRPDGQPRRALDTSRAREAFGFVATTPFEAGLRQTIDAYEATRRPGVVHPSSRAE